jgi:hypothetical protein
VTPGAVGTVWVPGAAHEALRIWCGRGWIGLSSRQGADAKPVGSAKVLEFIEPRLAMFKTSITR